MQSAPLGTFLTILWTSGRLRLPAATTSLLLLHCLLLHLLHCLRRLLLLHPLCYFSTSTTVPAPNIQQCPPYSQITPTSCTQHYNWLISVTSICGLTISHICAHNWSIMSFGPGLLVLLVQYGFLWKSEAGLLLLHSYCVSCVTVLVHLVEWSWYCTSSLSQPLSRVDLVRLTLLTMPDFGDKPQKEGETPLLAKLSNS